ncbi:MAG: SagB/ThcOx family dehydrogenase [Chloroflexi bacterium]|nr:SagB/ThcOx family dehydrogenase [Chloroflexota bacterium]
MDDITIGRQFLKSDRWDELRTTQTDQKKKVPFPPLEKPYPSDAKLIDLVSPQDFTVGKIPLIDAIKRRRSHRIFSPEALSLEELSFLLWATQGVKEIIFDSYGTKRTVPSGGARHTFETYLFVNRVMELPTGLYRYLALEHKLSWLCYEPELYQKMNEATRNQNNNAAVIFVWTTIPYRCEWRYSFLAPKLIALDAGHVCQNLYLACEAIDAGMCAVDAYDQTKMDAVLGVDGVDEFAIYMATVGKQVH